jgi:hypothetical protein
MSTASTDDASSFDSPVLFEPEGDAWVDHGGPNNGLVSDISAATEPSNASTLPTSSSSEKNVSWDDVVVDKPYSQEGASTPCLCHNPKPSWKKREQQASAHLYVVPSYSQVPPMACHLSRKKVKYWQRMARHAEVGDQFLLSLEDSPESLEEPFGGPVAQFIKLSAADSGLDPSQTQDLLVKLVHPPFLKAKAEAIKADNPDWRQAMSGPFANEFCKAAVKEYHMLEGMDVWEIVDQPLCAKIVDIIWAFKMKQFTDGLIKGFKGRICA